MTITIPACQTSNQTINLNGKTRKMNMQLLKQWNPEVPYISCVGIQAVSCLRWALEDTSHLAAANLNCFVSRCSQEGYRPGQQERRVHLSVLPYFTEWPWHVPALLWTMKVWSRDSIVGPCHFSCWVSQSHCLACWFPNPPVREILLHAQNDIERQMPRLPPLLRTTSGDMKWKGNWPSIQSRIFPFCHLPSFFISLSAPPPTPILTTNYLLPLSKLDAEN